MLDQDWKVLGRRLEDAARECSFAPILVKRRRRSQRLASAGAAAAVVLFVSVAALVFRPSPGAVGPEPAGGPVASPAAPTPPAAWSTPAVTADPADLCVATDLVIQTVVGDDTRITIGLMNRGPRRCQILGRPELLSTDEGGSVVPLNTVAQDDPDPPPVVLEHRASAAFSIYLSPAGDAARGGAHPCRTPASYQGLYLQLGTSRLSLGAVVLDAGCADVRTGPWRPFEASAPQRSTTSEPPAVPRSAPR
jgi:hypothetical protein